MNPTVFAMRRPVTTLMLVVALISGGVLAYSRMRVDIFPVAEHAEDLRLPRLHRHEPRPDRGVHRQPARALLPVRRRHPGHQHAEHPAGRACASSRSFPGTDMGQAMAQVVAMSDRAMSWMPKGTLPPMIMRMDAGSVPVGYLVFESEETSLGLMGDLRRTSSGRWCRSTSPARWRSRRSARTCGRSSSTSTPRSCSTTT